MTRHSLVNKQGLLRLPDAEEREFMMGFLESQELSNVSLLACVRHDLTQRLSMKAFGFRRE